MKQLLGRNDSDQPSAVLTNDEMSKDKGTNVQDPLADSILNEAPRNEEPSELERATMKARDLYWNKVGRSDPELISYVINPQFRGAPPWPGGRQGFRIVRTGDSIIIASEGMSDPFRDRPENRPDQGNSNGFGMEVFIEIPGWQRKSIDVIKESWAFGAVEVFAQNTANAGGFVLQLDAHGVMSMELPVDRAPGPWVSDNQKVGALIDVPITVELKVMQDMPIAPVRVVPLSLIHPSELNYCLKGGASARQDMAQALIAAGYGHRTEISRGPLR